MTTKCQQDVTAMKKIDWTQFASAREQNRQNSAGEQHDGDTDQTAHPPPGAPVDEYVAFPDEKSYRAFMDAELAANENDAFDDTVDAMVRAYEGDPEGLWEKLTYGSYDPKKVLRALKDHHNADSEIDPMLLMETFMETYDYPYANYARFAIGTIVGFNHVRLIRTRGKSYWQEKLGDCDRIGWKPL
jgi:hypothetical protein